MRNPQTRALIARRAAELMAEHGIRDHALAKRKAARQLGMPANQGLPSNEEIDAELEAYQALFEPDEHPAALAEARQQALEAMVTLERFAPVLTGWLAQGRWTPFADIEIEVYADSSKEFEQFLLSQQIAFKTEERREGSFFTLFGDPADVRVRILPCHLRQSGPRTSDEPRRRLDVAELRRVLTADPEVVSASST